MTTEKKTTSPYRGSCDALRAINEVPIDISLLAQESVPIFDGQPVRRFFPVRAQVTWFRLKNGNNGTVQTEMISQDDFKVVMKATVTIDGVPVSNAYGSADVQNDEGLKLIETAESRAIARALDFAGYGCQLDLNIEGEPQDSAQAPQEGQPADPQVPSQEAGESPATAQPGVMTRKMTVDANAPSEIIDIHDLEAAQEAAEEAKPQSRRGRKKKAEEPQQSESASQAEAEPQTADQASPEDPSAPDAAAENALEAVDEPKPSAAEPTSVEPAAQAPQAGPDLHQQWDDDESLSAEQKVWNYVQFAVGGDYADPQLDPRFFGEQNQNPESYFVNGDTMTKMKNRELQWALTYLEEHPDLMLEIQYPSSKGQFAGHSFGEIYGAQATNVANQAVGNCKNLYHGKNVPAYAATLLLVDRMNKR